MQKKSIIKTTWKYCYEIKFAVDLRYVSQRKKRAQVKGKDFICGHSASQEVDMCRTQKNHAQLTGQASKGIHSGFETQRRHQPKFKQGYQLSHEKG